MAQAHVSVRARCLETTVCGLGFWGLRFRKSGMVLGLGSSVEGLAWIARNPNPYKNIKQKTDAGNMKSKPGACRDTRRKT